MRKQTILLLSLLLLIVLGGFYTQPLLAKEEPLRVVFETTSGDEAALDGLTLLRNSTLAMGNDYPKLRPFRLTSFRNKAE